MDESVTKHFEGWDEVSVVLRRAAQLIQERGWIQGDYYSGNSHTGRVCAEGAISAAISKEGRAHPHYLSSREQQLFSAAIFRVEGRFLDFGDLPGWNDASERSRDEVIGLLERAALCPIS